MIGALVTFVIYLIILGVIIWLLLWLVDYIPLAEPFHRVARVVIIVLGVLILILLLLGLIGEAPSLRLRPLTGLSPAAVQLLGLA